MKSRSRRKKTREVKNSDSLRTPSAQSLVNRTKEGGKSKINNQRTNERSRRVIVNCGTSGATKTTKSV